MERHPCTLCVLAAAGSSERMNGRDKLFTELCGKPVLQRTLEAYAASELVDAIYVVTKASSMEAVTDLIRKAGIPKVECVLQGGETRQISVRNALDEVGRRREERRFKYIAIADAARCLITVEQIDSVIREAYRTEAATAACPATDTVALGKDGWIGTVPDRSGVFLLSTPQVMKYTLYMAAAYSAEQDGFTATDDNALVLRIGHGVKLVDVGRENIKITTPSDLTVAEALLKARKEVP